MIAISTLLPPSPQPARSPPHFLSSSKSGSAIIGPLPPTSPIHLALAHLHLSDLPNVSSITSTDSAASPQPQQSSLKPSENAVNVVLAATPTPMHARVFIVTGSKNSIYGRLEEDDEDWLRDNGSKLYILNRLKRVDIRYCPTIKHVKLLLTLLSSSATDLHSADSTTSHQESTISSQPPTLIILYDIASLLKEDIEANENVRPGDEQRSGQAYRKDVCISDYLDIISAARAAAVHFSQISGRTELVILEPSVGADDSLPIILGDLEAVAKSARERRVQIQHGLRWMLGDESVICVKPVPQPMNGEEKTHPTHTHTITVGNDILLMNRVPCPRSEFAFPVRPDGQADEERHGWRWEWV